MMESDEISAEMKFIGLQLVLRTRVSQTENIGVFALDLQLVCA
jgi:hypothetical protein